MLRAHVVFARELLNDWSQVLSGKDCEDEIKVEEMFEDGASHVALQYSKNLSSGGCDLRPRSRSRQRVLVILTGTSVPISTLVVHLEANPISCWIFSPYFLPIFLWVAMAIMVLLLWHSFSVVPDVHYHQWRRKAFMSRPSQTFSMMTFTPSSMFCTTALRTRLNVFLAPLLGPRTLSSFSISPLGQEHLTWQ